MLRTATRHLSTTVRQASAFADIQLPKDIPLHAPAPLVATSQLASGLRVGAYDTHGPASSLTLLVPAGARAETSDTAGAAHFLKNYALKYTATQTPIKIARELELRGVRLTAKIEREFLAYEAQFLRDDLPFVVELLSDIVYNTKYNHWEFKDVAARTTEQIAEFNQHPAHAALEMAHRLAFRQGLGNSIVAPAFNTITNDKVKQFAEQHLAINQRAALFGVGVNPEELAELANVYFEKATESSSTTPSKYFGGESRIEMGTANNLTLAFAGAAANSKDAATLSVLASLLGGPKYLKWADGASPLAKAGKNAHARVRAFHLGYSDAGLFGLSATCLQSPHNVTKGIQGAVVALKEAAKSVPAAELTRAVNQAKATAYATLDGQATRAFTSATHLATAGKLVAFNELATQLSAVSAKDVSAAAQKLLSSKPTIVAAGKTADLPYADTLGL